MKFPIALITLLCVSAINSAPVSEKICPKFDHDLAVAVVKNIVRMIPNWRVNGTFRENLLNAADKFIDSKPAVYWDEKVDAKTNLVILTDLVLKDNPIVAFDLEKSLESNVGTLVEFINNNYLSLLTLDKTQALNLIVRMANDYGFEGIDAKKSLHENVVIFVETGLKNIKVEDIHSLKDWVNAVIVHETENFLSFGPETTIQEIVAGFLDVNYFLWYYLPCVTKH